MSNVENDSVRLRHSSMGSHMFRRRLSVGRSHSPFFSDPFFLFLGEGGGGGCTIYSLRY